MGNETPFGVVLVLSLVWSPAGFADDAPLAGGVDVVSLASDEGLRTLDLRGRFDLSRSIRLDAFASKAWAPGGDEAEYGHGTLRLGDFRMAGGGVGDDLAFHLGYGPKGTLELLGDDLVLRGGFDLALGAGFLGDRDQAGGRLRSYYPLGVDLYSGSLAVALELVARPWERLDVGLGGYADLLAALAAPGQSDDTLRSLGVRLGGIDAGLSSSLSEATAGSFGWLALRLIDRRSATARSNLTLSYREAWDWIHLDPLYRLAREEELGGIRLSRLPPRQTRSVRLTWRSTWRGGELSLGLGGQHVRDSTTLLGFDDRDGWSIEGSLGGRWGRFGGQVAARYHFAPAPVEAYWGELPRYQVAGRAGARVLGDDRASLRVEAGARVTLSDSLGLPRAGHAVFAQLRVQFGGARPTRHDPADESALPLLLAPEAAPEHARAPTRSLDPVGKLVANGGALASSGAARKALAETPAPVVKDVRGRLESIWRETPGHERRALQAELRRLTSGPLDRGAVGEALGRQPALRERIERHFPGLLGVLGLGGDERRAAIVSGYGRRGLQLGLVKASQFAVTRRHDGGLAGEQLRSPFGAGSLSAFVRERRIEKFSLLVPRGRRYRVLVQARSRWSGIMRRLLSGR